MPGPRVPHPAGPAVGPVTRRGDGYSRGMLGCLIMLLVLFAAIAILGLAVKGAIWLFVVGLLLFLITSGVTWLRRRL